MLEFELKDAKFDGGEPIIEWDHIQIDDFFIFYKQYDLSEKLGFRFMTIQIMAHTLGEPLLYPSNIVEILYWGYAMFDGIRHLYFGHNDTDNYGYINYPNIVKHMDVLKVLKDLEIKYCSYIN